MVFSRLDKRLWPERLRQLVALSSVMIGAAVLLGWMLDVAALKSVLPGMTSMKANTALGFVASGSGLLLLGAGPSRLRLSLAAALGLLTLLTGGLTLCEYLSFRSFGIDELLFLDPLTTSAPFNGRMAPATAAGFTVTGAAISLLAYGASNRDVRDRSVLAAHVLAIITGSIGYLSLAGYAYEAKAMYRMGPYVAVALHTALGFILVAAALIMTMPKLGWQRNFASSPVAEKVLVRLLPAALLVPLLAGAVVVWGARLSWYDPLFAPALLALVASLAALGLAYHGATAVRTAEAQLGGAISALAIGEERLRIAQKAGRVGTFEYYPATGQLDASEDYRQIWGLPLDGPLDPIYMLSLVHPDDRGLIATSRSAAFTNPLAYSEYRITRPDTGEERWIARRGEAILSEGGPRWLGVVFDITEQKRAGAALAESEAWFRTLVSAMPQQIFITSPDGANRFTNRRWQEYTGQRELGSSPWSWLEYVHEADRTAMAAAWTVSMSEGTTFEAERRLRAADGSYAWFLTRAEPLRDAEGRITTWFGTNTDISEIVAARESSARSQANLERLVEERTRDLHQTQARLAHAQRIEALGQLAGGIAHDFNNVMQSILGAASLIDKKAADPARVRRFAGLITDAATRGGTITRRLLTFARRGDLRTESVEPAALLNNMQEILAHTLGGSIPVQVALEGGLMPFAADLGQLETVLVNLATNARDAMPSGGTLHLAAALDEIVAGQHGASPLQPGKYVRLQVTDSGTGMPEAVLARAVEPFFTTKEMGKGTGLGLAMARGFAEQSGGGMHIDSAPGMGTTVTLWFPVTAGRIQTRHDPEVAAALRSPRLSGPLLMVDDDELVRNTLVLEMEEHGYTVLAAASGAEALQMLNDHPAITLLVADLSMPVMDGITLIQTAKQRRPALPCLLLTGFATDTVERALKTADQQGTFTLLRKPISGAALAQAVATALTQASHHESKPKACVNVPAGDVPALT